MRDISLEKIAERLLSVYDEVLRRYARDTSGAGRELSSHTAEG
jgi:hypothetical protein